MTESLIPHQGNGGAGGTGSMTVTVAYPRINGRICDAMADINAVPKSQTNAFHKYKFRGIDDVLTAVHPILAKHRLFMVPRLNGDPKVVERNTTGGKAELHIVVRVLWRIITDDGSSVEFETLGEASDTGDKASNKAMSASMKYALIQAFSIPVAESDRDADERSPELKAKTLADVTARLAPVTLKETIGPLEVHTSQEVLPAGAGVPPEAFDVPKQEEATPAAKATALCLRIATVDNEHEGANWKKKHRDEINALPPPEKKRVVDAFTAKMATFSKEKRNG